LLLIVHLLFVSAKTVCHRIVRSLIPASVVPEVAVLKLVSTVCAGIPALDTQVLLQVYRDS